MWKVLLFVAIYVVLHFGYELTQLELLRPFCGTDESVFEHLKIGFWAYFFSTVIEYFATKSIRFWFPRLLANVLVPWTILLVWYMFPLFAGHTGSPAAEIIWAFVVVFIVGLLGVAFERDLEKTPLRSRVKVIVFLLFVLSIVFYVGFSFSKPEVDLFRAP